MKYLLISRNFNSRRAILALKSKRLEAAAILLLILLLHTPLFAAHPEGLKVICASRAETAPVIDGILDDACWQKTEMRDDFTSVGVIAPAAQRITMRIAYDDNNLYIAFEFYWKDINVLKKGITDILKKHGSNQKQPCQIKNFTNLFGGELFIDKGATRKNYSQILFNAAGQLSGHRNMHWDLYTGEGQSFKGKIKDDCWSIEFVYPAKNMKPGDRWGLNLARNTEVAAYAIWKQTDGAFNNPQRFGTMIIGSYQEWWQAVWTEKIVKHLTSIRNEAEKQAKNSPELSALYNAIMKEVANVEQIAKENPLDNRTNFENTYLALAEFNKRFNRFLSMVDFYGQVYALSQPTRRERRRNAE